MATSRAESRRFNTNGPRPARGAFSTCARRVHLGTNRVAAHPRVSRPIDPDRRVGATRHFDPAGPNPVRDLDLDLDLDLDRRRSLDRSRSSRPPRRRSSRRSSQRLRSSRRSSRRSGRRASATEATVPVPPNLVALGQSASTSSASPDSFPTDVLFPGDVFRAARFAVRGREQHGTHGARVRRLRHARFRGATRASIAARSFSRIRSATAACAPSPPASRVPPPPRPTI